MEPDSSEASCLVQLDGHLGLQFAELFFLVFFLGLSLAMYCRRVSNISVHRFHTCTHVVQ